LTRGWFQTFFSFSPLVGAEFQFEQYFSNGLVQPPTPRKGEAAQLLSAISGWSAPHCDDSPFKRGVEGMMDD